MKMYMSMMTLVQNYENEDEHIEDMFRLEEQFISYSDRIAEHWNLEIEDLIQNSVNIVYCLIWIAFSWS